MGFRNDEAAAVRELERQRTRPVYGYVEEEEQLDYGEAIDLAYDDWRDE